MQMPQDMQGMKVSPDMLNFGLSAGQEMLSKQRERLMPGVSTFWLSLKFYFSVHPCYNYFIVCRLLVPYILHCNHTGQSYLCHKEDTNCVVSILK